MHSRVRLAVLTGFCLALAACGRGPVDPADREAQLERQRQNIVLGRDARPFDRGDRDTIFDLFRSTDSDREMNVNKHLWAAALDVLSFLPIEAADPFSGVIATGWGRVNGASPAYRATVYVSGPALEARSLRVAVFRQSGGGALAVSDEVASEIEDSILTRARQMRIAAEGR